MSITQHKEPKMATSINSVLATLKRRGVMSATPRLGAIIAVGDSSHRGHGVKLVSGRKGTNGVEKVIINLEQVSGRDDRLKVCTLVENASGVYWLDIDTNRKTGGQRGLIVENGVAWQWSTVTADDIADVIESVLENATTASLGRKVLDTDAHSTKKLWRHDARFANNGKFVNNGKAEKYRKA
jgi:hypothetical protein